MCSPVLLYGLDLLYEIVSYYGLERRRLPHDLLHFNAFKVREFNIKNKKNVQADLPNVNLSSLLLGKNPASGRRFGKS